MKKNEGMIYKRGKTWWIKFYRAGRPFYESSHSDKITDARALLASRLGEKADGKPAPIRRKVTVGELLNDLISDYQVNSHKDLYQTELRVRKHLRPYFEHVMASSLTRATINEYIVKRLEAKKRPANATINRELAALKRAFNLGIHSGKIHARPYIEMLTENNVRRGFFEPNEYASIRKHLPEELQPVLDFAYLTGWRKSEILNLEWRHVDFEAGRIRLDPGTTKSGDARTFPFTADLAELLQAQKAKRDALAKLQNLVIPWVFFRKDGRQIKDFYTAWRNACREAKIAGKRLHDCRRTAVRRFSRAGIPDRVGMELSGHRTRAIYDRYRIVSESDLLEAAKRLDSNSVTVKMVTKRLQFAPSKKSTTRK